ncbi:hypothetical protein I3842_10G027800 [Carya illinoinensis]|uniref:Uncharacterized protein n=1 Tax=Carya illinoinensis TaxID=32201 RepID=A0A922DU09_CARIL|nr:hypothetical protein I3842_10G027800 [Carya illinoinensis]
MDADICGKFLALDGLLLPHKGSSYWTDCSYNTDSLDVKWR